MKIKNLAAALLAALSLLCISCGKSSELYSFRVKTNEGKEIKMSQFKGKVLLIANTDYTPRAADGEVFCTCSYICNCGLCRRTSFGDGAYSKSNPQNRPSTT